MSFSLWNRFRIVSSKMASLSVFLVRQWSVPHIVIVVVSDPAMIRMAKLDSISPLDMFSKSRLSFKNDVMKSGRAVSRFRRRLTFSDTNSTCCFCWSMTLRGMRNLSTKDPTHGYILATPAKVIPFRKVHKLRTQAWYAPFSKQPNVSPSARSPITSKVKKLIQSPMLTTAPFCAESGADAFSRKRVIRRSA